MTESEKRWEAFGLTKELQGEVKKNIAELFESVNKELPIVKKVYAEIMGDVPKNSNEITDKSPRLPRRC